MKYTYQEVSESGSFSMPYPDDVKHANSKRELESALCKWENEHYRVGSDETMASLWVSIGLLKDIEYPDFIAIHGPRGGFQLSQA